MTWRRFPLVLWAGLAAFVVAAGGAGAAVALSSSSAVRPAAACPAPGPPYYAYAVPSDPAHPPAAGSDAPSWGWMPRIHPLQVGNWIRVNGHMWRVTEVAAMPGVEPACRAFGILGLPPRSPFGKGLVMAGRLVLQPVG
jgi:hypothetical protein